MAESEPERPSTSWKPEKTDNGSTWDIRGKSSEGGIMDKRNIFRGKTTFGTAKQRREFSEWR